MMDTHVGRKEVETEDTILCQCLGTSLEGIGTNRAKGVAKGIGKERLSLPRYGFPADRCVASARNSKTYPSNTRFIFVHGKKKQNSRLSSSLSEGGAGERLCSFQRHLDAIHHGRSADNGCLSTPRLSQHFSRHRPLSIVVVPDM